MYSLLIAVALVVAVLSIAFTFRRGSAGPLQRRNKAVVIGGGIAGLLAASALSRLVLNRYACRG
jgi:hypothetical protein